MTSPGDDGDPDLAGPVAPRQSRHRLVIAATVVVAVVVTALLALRWPSGSASAPDATAVADTAPKQLTATDIYKLISPSLVYIQVETGATTGSSGDGTGVGTGVVVNADGSILTALHVVAEAKSVEVIFADGTRSAAHVVSSVPEQDTAVLNADTLPSVIVPAVLGSSRSLEVGDPAIAVGNPLGLVGTATAGVISGLDRSIPSETGVQLDGVIQFDAAVNPGSSGGPLLDADGEIVGIVVALEDPSKAGYFIGIGFAVPIGSALGRGGGQAPPQ